MQPNPVSYRDPRSSVELREDHVVRVFRGEGAADFEAFVAHPLHAALVSEGKVVPFEATGSNQEILTGRSPRYWSVSYPYEWSFSMLKDAALLTLELTERCLEADFELRDASAFNIVFVEGGPMWVDLGSFGKRRAGIWQGYAQFLDHFVNPLAAASFSGQGIAPEWSGSLEGLPAPLARKRTSLVFLARHGLLRHIALRARLYLRAEHNPTGGPSSAEGPVLPASALMKIVQRLRKSVEKLQPNFTSHWQAYETHNTYADEESTRKAEVVKAMLDHLPEPSIGLDVGANTGRFSAVLAETCEKVVAVDSDEAAIDVLYQRVKVGELPGHVLPLVGDVLDFTPGRGLMARERASATERFGPFDVVLWLAVVHHLAITRNVPPQAVAELFESLGANHIAEIPSIEDEMVRTLTARKSEGFEGDLREVMLAALTDAFSVLRREEITSSRTMVCLAP